MHEEAMPEKFKKKSKKAKIPPSLNIPDPTDLFKLEVLNRPPSVPIFGRRLSSESLLHNREDSPLLHYKLPFKKSRRKSIPDRLYKKPPVIRRNENKAKPLKISEKPPLDKSSKCLRLKSSKNLIKKSSLSTPQITKVNQKLPKLLVPDADKRKLDNNTPHRMTRKNSDGKECEEFKKNLYEPRGIIVKHDDVAKAVKISHKASRSVLSIRNEEKGMKKVKKSQENRISPPKKRTRKKSEHGEKSSSHSKLTKKKKEKNQAKLLKILKDQKKKGKKGKKTKEKKEKIECFENHEKWLDPSFFIHTKGRQFDSLELGDAFEDAQQVLQDLQSSNELHLSIPSNEDRFSRISSIAGLSLPDSLNNRPKSPIPFDLDRSSKLKIIKKSNPRQLLKTQAAIKIQKAFRNYLKHKKSLKNSSKLEESLKKSPKSFFRLSLQSAEDLKTSNKENSFNESEDDQKKFPGFKDLSSEQLKNRFSDEFLAGSEEIGDKSDYQAPKPAEIVGKVKGKPCDPEKESKEAENLLFLDSLKIKKASIDDLRRRDLEAIKRLTPRSGSETEIFQIFQNIINRRYETINSMFDDNIKAVQEALAQSVISEESFSFKTQKKVEVKDFPLQTTETVSIPSKSCKKSQEFEGLDDFLMVKNVEFKQKNESDHENRFFLNLEKCVNRKTEVVRTKSPEIVSPYVLFRNFDQGVKKFLCDESPEMPSFRLPRKSAESEGKHQASSRIMWIDEVAMPRNIDLTDLIIESGISEMYSVVLDDILNDLFTVTSSAIIDLSEELIFAILLHEIQEKISEMKKNFDEDSILLIIQKIFIKTQNLIVTELLKPLEKDPLAFLAEIQEAEIGCGFEPEEKYSMLNLEAFQEDLSSENDAIKVFNSMVFDCINECLEKLIVKEDLPWSTVRYKRIIARTSEEVINYIVNRLIRFSEIKAGEIGFDAEKNDLEISQKREFDIVKMLAVEVVDDEVEWVRYDKEELQAKLDLADMILEQEIDEIVDIICDGKIV